MTHHIGPENPDYRSELSNEFTPRDNSPNLKAYMISQEGLERFLNNKGPNIVRKADGTVVIEEGDKD